MKVLFTFIIPNKSNKTLDPKIKLNTKVHKIKNKTNTDFIMTRFEILNQNRIQ